MYIQTKNTYSVPQHCTYSSAQTCCQKIFKHFTIIRIACKSTQFPLSIQFHGRLGKSSIRHDYVVSEQVCPLNLLVWPDNYGNMASTSSFLSLSILAICLLPALYVKCKVRASSVLFSGESNEGELTLYCLKHKEITIENKSSSL